MQNIKDTVIKYYISIFDRIPDKDAVDYWYEAVVNNNWKEIDLINALLNAAKDVAKSKEYKGFLEFYNLDENNLESVSKIIERVYKSLFDKDLKSDKEGILYWSKKIVNKEISLAEAIYEIQKFTENVYEGKIDLSKIGYNKEEIAQIKKAINTYEARFEFAKEIYKDISNISLKDLDTLEDVLNIIHSEKDFAYAKETLIESNLIHYIKESSPSIDASIIDEITAIDLPLMLSNSEYGNEYNG